MARNARNYLKVASIARELTALGYCIVSGGGPGVMEAANFGAYTGALPREVLADALAILAKVPTYGDHDEYLADYIAAAREVLRRYPDGAESLAIPTWAYADEPTSQFPSHLGKYFANSSREDGLLGIGLYGVIFAPGAGGTLQEIFQDATHNSYWTFHSRSPMVFLDSTFYQAVPAIYDLLRARAVQDGYGDFVTLQDDPAGIVNFIVTHPPVPEPSGAPRTIGRSSATYQLA